jgi:hypothetical protein
MSASSVGITRDKFPDIIELLQKILSKLSSAELLVTQGVDRKRDLVSKRLIAKKSGVPS